MTKHDILRREYKGDTNFMTPDVVKVRARENKGFWLVGEISKERYPYFGSKPMYGVTVVRAYPDGRTRRDPFKLSGIVESLADAESHLDRLGMNA